MDAVKKFNDVDFVVQQPETMDEDAIKNCDPNDILRIDLQRPPEWFLSTWKTYIKPKYKLAISRWDKLMGGGCCEPNKFSKLLRKQQMVSLGLCYNLKYRANSNKV
jgi:hypothetical protein